MLGTYLLPGQSVQWKTISFYCTGINFIPFGAYSTELWCKKLFTTGYHFLQGKNNLQMEDHITWLATHHSADFYNQVNIILLAITFLYIFFFFFLFFSSLSEPDLFNFTVSKQQGSIIQKLWVFLFLFCCCCYFFPCLQVTC